MTWYVARVTAGGERKAADWLDGRCDVFLPLRRVGHVVRRTMAWYEPALFPGYLFVAAWAACIEAPGVYGFLGGEEPEEVEDAVVDGVRERCDGRGVYIEDSPLLGAPGLVWHSGDLLRVPAVFGDRVGTVRLGGGKWLWVEFSALHAMGSAVRVASELCIPVDKADNMPVVAVRRRRRIGFRRLA